MVSNATLLSYVAFTAAVTEWRTTFLRNKNRLENDSSSMATESLMNYETVKYFGKEADESARYSDILRGIEKVRVFGLYVDWSVGRLVGGWLVGGVAGWLGGWLVGWSRAVD